MEFAFQNAIEEMEFSHIFPLHTSCKNGDSQAVKFLLEKHARFVLLEDKFWGWTPAHWAAYFGKLDCLRNVLSILPSCANHVNRQTSKGFLTPAHCAAEAGHPHCLLWLLQAGANPNLKDSSGETPLHKCARTGSAECVSLLIASSCNIRIANNSGEFPSVLAEKSGHQAIAAYIHQAELAKELCGNMPVANMATTLPNGFNHPFSNNPNGVVGNSLKTNRKRSLDDNNNEISKKICVEGVGHQATMSVLNMTDTASDPLPLGSSSFLEHENLCTVEQSYTSAMLGCMISEFHGC